MKVSRIYMRRSPYQDNQKLTKQVPYRGELENPLSLYYETAPTIYKKRHKHIGGVLIK